MLDKFLLFKITEIANELDNKGLFEEASELDVVIKQAQFAIGGPTNLPPYYIRNTKRKVEKVKDVDKEKSEEKSQSVKPVGRKDSRFQEMLEREINK